MNRKISMANEENTIDTSEEGSREEMGKGGRKKRRKLERGQADKVRIR